MGHLELVSRALAEILNPQERFELLTGQFVLRMSSLKKRRSIEVARAVSFATGTPCPQVLRSLLCFFGCCLFFVLLSCSSAGSTTNTPTITVAPTAPVGHHVIYTGHGGAAVISVTWSPDGTRIASASQDGTVQV